VLFHPHRKDGAVNCAEEQDFKSQVLRLERDVRKKIEWVGIRHAHPRSLESACGGQGYWTWGYPHWSLSGSED